MSAGFIRSSERDSRKATPHLFTASPFVVPAAIYRALQCSQQPQDRSFFILELFMRLCVIAGFKVYFNSAFMPQCLSAFVVAKLPAGYWGCNNHRFIQKSALKSILLATCYDTLF